MKSLFCYRYLTLGGVEAVLRARLAHLDETGVEAHLWFLQDHGGGGMFAQWPDRLHVGGLSALAQHLAVSSYDTVSTVDTDEVLPLLTGPRRPAVIVEAHSAYTGSSDYLGRLSASDVEAVFVPSRRQAALVAERLTVPVELRVVPNPVHDDFLEDLVDPGARPARPIIAWVGRLDEHKDWRMALAVGSAVLRAKDVELWLVGQPVEPGGAEVLHSKAKELGVLQRLRWWSGVPHHRIPALLDLVRASGGVTLTTSRDESFGMTVVEGMARGCAVVVPGQPPFDEYVDSGRSGLSYSPGDAASAALAVQSLIDDDALRISSGQCARAEVRQRFGGSGAAEVLARELGEAKRRRG